MALRTTKSSHLLISLGMVGTLHGIMLYRMAPQPLQVHFQNSPCLLGFNQELFWGRHGRGYPFLAHPKMDHPGSSIGKSFLRL